MGTKPGVDGKERNSEGIEQGNEEREICGAGCVETATGRPGDGDQGSGAEAPPSTAGAGGNQAGPTGAQRCPATVNDDQRLSVMTGLIAAVDRRRRRQSGRSNGPNQSSWP